MKQKGKIPMNCLNNKINLFAIGLILICFSISCFGRMTSQPGTQPSLSQSQLRPRIICTTDPECDDLNSLVRFLLHSTDYNVAGLVYASSQYHWKGDGKGTKYFVEGREYTRYGLNMGPMESWRWPADGKGHIDQVVNAYQQAYPNLKVHNPNYPTPEYLRSIIRYGNIEFDGVFDKDTPGSDFIKSLILDDIPGPLYITAWGGQSTIARALKSIQDQYENIPPWSSIREKITKKVIILPSGDQDDTGAKYIRPNWPELYLQGMRGGNRMGLGYGAQSRQSEYSSYYTSEFMKEHVSGKGPMGAVYRVWGDGKGLVENDIFDYFGFSGYTDEALRAKGYIVWTPVQEKGSWLGEGDTPTFLNMLDFGLRNIENPSYGGVGGYQAATSAGGMAGRGAAGGGPGGRGAAGSGYPDFSGVIQNDFLARLEWSATPEYKNANHPPQVSIDGPLDITARPGEEVRLAGKVSDPDGNPVTIKWWEFQVVDSYEGEVTIASPTSASTTVVVPANAAPGQTIHLILEASDNAPLPLTRYQRVIITVK
jgi:hypothetical protein